MDKIDDNSRTNPSEKFDDYTQNPWTRQAARERNKRKRNALMESSELCPVYRRFAKGANIPKVKQQRQESVCLRERSISARHRIGKRWIKCF